MARIIHLHPDAPAKPAPGDGCNGCGVCCAIAPCPLGMVVSRRRSGSCTALRWDTQDGRYRCGLVAEPQAHLPRAAARAAPWLRALALRSISAGSGCDCAWEATPGTAATPGTPAP